MTEEIAQTRTVNGGGILRFGRFQQGDRGRDRDVKPLEWLVLDVCDGKALLLTKQGIDVKWYHKSSRSVTWETCTLRTRFLNDVFLHTAFSPAERKRILTTTVRAHPNPLTGTDPGARRLKNRILAYAAGDDFSPSMSLTGTQLAALCKASPVRGPAIGSDNEAVNRNDITV